MTSTVAMAPWTRLALVAVSALSTGCSGAGQQSNIVVAAPDDAPRAGEPKAKRSTAVDTATLRRHVDEPKKDPRVDTFWRTATPGEVGVDPAVAADHEALCRDSGAARA